MRKNHDPITTDCRECGHKLLVATGPCPSPAETAWRLAACFAEPRRVRLERGSGPYILIGGRAVMVGQYAQDCDVPTYHEHLCQGARPGGADA